MEPIYDRPRYSPGHECWAPLSALSFGGVISFIFADLITFPLLLIYRKYYGTALTVRLLVLFWAVMAVAGLIVEGLFSVAGLIPHHRPQTIVATHLQWNYTTYLNIVFLAVFAGLYWLYRNRGRLGGGRGYAIDPVCGMQVRTANAPASATYAGQRYWFCSDRCRDRFDTSAAGFTHPGAKPGSMEEPVTLGITPPRSAGAVVDPVCGMTIDSTSAAVHRLHRGRELSFCGAGCATEFDSDPDRYASGRPAPSEHHQD
jgi:uncharacterized protein